MNKTLTTIQGDMWDLISYRAYGTEQGVKALMDANPDLADQLVLPGGLMIVIPDYEPPTSNLLPPWRR